MAYRGNETWDSGSTAGDKLNDRPPRLRLAANVDFSKAKSHLRCNGTGIVGYREMVNPEHQDETIKVPVVCRCVSRRGGIKRDAFDRIASEIEQQVADGTFAENLAGDVGRLPVEARIRKIQELKQTAASGETDQTVRDQISKALGILEQEA